MRRLFILCTGVLFCISAFCQLQQIQLKASDAYANQHKKDDFSKLSDGDLTSHYTVWSPQIIPYRITYDWSNYDNAVVKQLRFFVNNGNPSQLKYYIRKQNGEEKLLYSYIGGGWIPEYQTVNIDNVEPATAFIIESSGGSDFPDEIEVYGRYTQHAWPTIARTASPLKDLFGVVLKPWDISFGLFPEKLPTLLDLKLSRTRLYNDYNLNHHADGSWDLHEPTGWKQEDNMLRLKDSGVSTQMCYLAFPYEPYPAGDVRLNPETYLQLAKDVFDFGVDNKANGEYFKTIEVGNEMNRWYAGNFDEYMDGYALAAMMSICYDGHKGKYPGVGLKASGSQASVSIGGLAESEPYILYQIAQWSEKNRGYRADGTIDLPFDIYSVHIYSSLAGQRAGIPGGISPVYGMEPYMKRLNEIRLHKFPWLKIHIGEWGWDISENSSLNAPAFGPYNAHQVSGMWTVEAILLMAENGIDASSYYRVKQDYDALNDGSYIPFETMALLRMSGGTKQPDGSYTGMDIHRTLTGDYFRQLSLLLSEGWVFDSRVASSPIVLKFRKGASQLFVIWNQEAMTVTNRPVFTEITSTYTLPYAGIIKRLVDDSSGVMSNDKYLAGTPITINAKPVFVVVDPVQTPLPIHVISFTAEKLNQLVQLQWIVQDADKIEVEKSTDASSWTNLGEGIFNKMVDDHPFAGSNYYRLKMYEQDGSFTYSDIRRVHFGQHRLTITVYNSAGQNLLVATTYNLDIFKQELKTNSKLLPGIYILRISDDNSFFFSDKFIK